MRPATALTAIVTLVLVSLELSLSPIHPARAAEPGVRADTVKIGTHLALSGPWAPVGVAIQRGMAIKVDRINQSGGVNQRQLELLVLDNASNTARAIELTHRLDVVEPVFAIVASCCHAAALAPMSLDTQRPHLFPFIADFSSTPRRPDRFGFTQQEFPFLASYQAALEVVKDVEADPVRREFDREYERRYAEHPAKAAAFGYMAITIFAAALNAGGATPTSTTLSHFLREMPKQPNPFGPVPLKFSDLGFGPFQDNAPENTPCPIQGQCRCKGDNSCKTTCCVNK